MKDKSPLQKELDQLWSGIINKVDFNIMEHTISFLIKIYETEEKTIDYSLIFHEVSSFYFLEDTGKDRFEIIPWEKDSILEFISIDHYENGIGNIKIQNPIDSWVDQWYSSANFAIEISVSMLFIEAKKVQINDKIFDVGYPKIND